jgi:alpha-D-ribose 1-methylphosphonate 5-triphosphate synthase subunit PhnG
MSEATANPRQEAMGVLSHAAPGRLGELWGAWAEKPGFHRVRGPETGLVMVRGRAGGGGNPFNLGEATVTRATVRLDTGEVGHAYCLGRDNDKAVQAALFDALWQRDPASVETQVLAPLRAEQAEADGRRRDETAATRVDFFTMVRGDD